MIDHLSTYARDYLKTKNFYLAVFSELGFGLQTEMIATWNKYFPTQRMCAFGPEGKPVFWVIEVKEAYTPRHVAFTASSRTQVDAFYKAALAQGAEDNGEPGLRPQYHEHFYGAFVIDPDGNNAEAVFHSPE
jgi:catechol 2,3-dioxygenase-like lactoylglutathione lyase family enzyme